MKTAVSPQMPLMVHERLLRSSDETRQGIFAKVEIEMDIEGLWPRERVCYSTDIADVVLSYTVIGD